MPTGRWHNVRPVVVLPAHTHARTLTHARALCPVSWLQDVSAQGISNKIKILITADRKALHCRISLALILQKQNCNQYIGDYCPFPALLARLPTWNGPYWCCSSAPCNFSGAKSPPWLSMHAAPGAGTSDEHISVVQYLKTSHVDGAVIVTTPQEVSIIDVRKEINFCKKVADGLLSSELPLKSTLPAFSQTVPLSFTCMCVCTPLAGCTRCACACAHVSFQCVCVCRCVCALHSQANP